MKIRKCLIIFVIIFLVGGVNATLEGAAFGFAKDMGMNYLSSQNPAVGQAISFAMCPQCAATGQAMSALNQVLPGSSEILNAIQSPEAYVMNKAKQEALTAISEQLDPEEQAILSNIEKVKPYIEEAFEVNPNAPKEQQKGSIEIAENGDTILKDGEGNIFATIPQGFEAVENKDEFILVNKNAKDDAILELKGNKIQLDKDSKFSFSEKEGVQIINIEAGNIQIGETTLTEVENAEININKENQIEFAEFTSKDGGDYIFDYAEKQFNFKAKQGGKIIFNPKENLVEGENTELILEGQSIESQKFQGILDKNGNFIELRLAKGNFKDDDKGLEYSSEEDFSIYFDGRDISKKGNAISISENSVDGKGFVKILKPDKLSYLGESQNALVSYDLEENLFDMKTGDAVIKNKKHVINVREGKASIDVQNLASEKLKDIEAEGFRVRTQKDGEKILTTIDEKGGLLTMSVGKEGDKPKTTVMQLSTYEKAIKEGIENLPEKRIQESIDEIKTELKKLEKNPAENKDKIDTLELVLAESENMQSISDGDVGRAITRIENYLKEPRALDAEFEAKLSLAEMYANSGEKDKAIEMYRSSLSEKYFREGINDSPARLSLAGLYLEEKDYKNARWAFSSLGGSESSNEMKSISKFGEAYVDLISGNSELEKTFQKLDESLELDSENMDARNLKKNLEQEFLKSVNKGLNQQREAASEAFNEYLLGDIDSDDGYLSILWKETARGISLGMDVDQHYGTIKGTSEKLFIEYEGVTHEIDQQQMGTIAMQKLLRDGEVDSMSYFSDENSFYDDPDLGRMWIETPEQVKLRKQSLLRRIGNSYNTDPNSDKAQGVYLSILYAKDNPDIKQLIDKTYTYNSLQGGDYVDISGLDGGLGNELLSGLDVKNVLLFAGPMATVKGTTVAQWGVKGIKAIPGLGGAVEGGGALKTTIGGARIMQKAAQTFPKLSSSVNFIGAEVLESGVGFLAERVVPGIGLPVEVLVGHSQAFDIAQEIGESIVKKGAIKQGKTFVTDNGEFIQSLIVKDADSYASFLKNKQVRQIEGGLVEINGKRTFLMAEDPSKYGLHGTDTIALKGILEERGLIPVRELRENLAEGEAVFSGKALPNPRTGEISDGVFMTSLDVGTDNAHTFSAGTMSWNPERGKDNIKSYERYLEEYLEKGKLSLKKYPDDNLNIEMVEYFESMIKNEKLKIDKWDSFSDLQKSLIEEPSPMILMVKHDGKALGCESYGGGMCGEIKVMDKVDEKNYVLYVAEDNIDSVKYQANEYGSKVEIKPISELNEDIKYLNDFGSDPLEILNEDVAGKLTSEQVAQVMSTNINGVAEASLGTGVSASKRIRALFSETEMTEISKITDETFIKFRAGESVEFVGDYPIVKVTNQDISEMSPEWKEYFEGGAMGAFNPDVAGGSILINIDKVSDKNLFKSALYHEYTHAKIADLTPEARRQLYDSVKSSPHFEIAQKKFIENAPAYKHIDEETLINEMFTFNAEKRFESVTEGWTGIDYSFANNLQELSKEFFYSILIIIN